MASHLRIDPAKMLMFLFTDAGYAPLDEAKSTRPFALVLGIFLNRGELMDCLAWSLMNISGEIMQVARPSLSDEAISLSCGIDYLHRARVYWYAILRGEFACRFILSPDQFPLQTPQRRDSASEENRSYATAVWRIDRASSSPVDMFAVLRDYNKWTDVSVEERRIRAISLTDCPNAYASVPSIASNSHDRSMKIILSYIRDNAATFCLSFADACFNLADTGTKTYSSLGSYRSFVSDGGFAFHF